MRNTRKILETIKDDNFKIIRLIKLIRGEEALNNFTDKLVIARNYLRLIKDDESKDRFETYLIDMIERLSELRICSMEIRYI